MMRLLSSLALALSLALMLGACASHTIDDSDPAALFKDAESDISDARYQLAIDKLRIVRNKFPYSRLSAEAQLRMGDVFFLQESFPEAAAAYETFRDLHPKHEKAGYAVFRVGESHFMDIPSPIARDLTPATKAVEAFQEYLRRFPKGEHSAQATNLLQQSLENLASKELYVGDFYFRDESWDAAVSRYKKVIDLYPTTESAKKAAEKLKRVEAKKPKEKAGG